MDYFTKKRILLWSLIMLIILNISTLGTIWFIKKPGNAPNLPPPQLNDIQFRGVNHFIRNELKFSEVQWQEFVTLRKKNMEETQALMEKMHTINTKMYDELISESPRERRIEKLTQEMGETHGELKLLSARFLLEVNNLCNADQKARLHVLFRELQSTPEIPGQGRQFRNRGQHRGLRNSGN